MFLQTTLAAETSFRGTGLKISTKGKKYSTLIDLEGMRKVTELRMEGQAIFSLKAFRIGIGGKLL
jgi:hypothetical protein